MDEYRFEVDPTQLDPDRIVDTIFLARRRWASAERRRNVLVLAVWVVGLMAGIAVLTGTSLAWSVLTISGFAVVCVWGLARSSDRTLRRTLRDDPALREAYRFTIGPTGTTHVTASATSTSDWSHWAEVAALNDHLVLRDDHGLLRIVPWTGLTTGAEPDEVVAAVGRWIAAAQEVSASAE